MRQKLLAGANEGGQNTMLCKKCKTAVFDEDDKCGFCGADLKKQRRKKILPMLVLVCIVAGLIIFISCISKRSSATSNEPVETVAAQQEKETAEPVAELVDDYEPAPTTSPDTSKTNEEVDVMLKESLEGIKLFYESYSPSINYISKNGYLYDIPGKAYVKINELIDTGKISEDYADKNILFLYLKESDLLGGSQSMSLSLYTAYETGNGYRIAVSDEEILEISAKDLQAIMEKYVAYHGEIVRFSSGSGDFVQIAKEIQEAVGATADLDVRYMAGDDKYAVAVVSQAGNPVKIEEYVFMKESGSWIIMISNFEGSEKYRVDINKILPDLSMQLLPSYNMRHYTNRMKGNFAEVIEGMKELRLIRDNDGSATFASGTTEYVYLEFQSGKRFVGHLNAEYAWEMFEIQDYAEGEEILLGFDKNPPLFVMKQY